MSEVHPTTSRIRQLNDLCRTAPGIGGKWVITEGISALDRRTQSRVREAIELFDRFDYDKNDPWLEHDFGDLVVDGHKIYWKIDYYDINYEFHSPDPADPTVTRRVLCVMLQDEY